jgi:EPS-associated MarR family transcriptional regulator
MNKPLDQETRYNLLKILSKDPASTQRDLAKRLGVSLGKVNRCLLTLGEEGFIRVTRSRSPEKKLGYAYHLTAKGLAEKGNLTQGFLKTKIQELDRIKRQIQDLTDELKQEPSKGAVTKLL